MKNFLLSLKFIIKRVFRLTAANIAWADYNNKCNRKKIDFISTLV